MNEIKTNLIFWSTYFLGTVNILMKFLIKS